MTCIFRSFLVASVVFAAFAAVQPDTHAQGFGGAFSSFFSDDKDDDSPVDVSASVADIYLEKNIITLLGNVIVGKKDTRITCNKMEIFLKDKTENDSDKEKNKTDEKKPEAKPAAQPVAVSPLKKDAKESKDDAKEDDGGMDQNISHLVCTGDVVYREMKQDDPNDDSLAMANKGVYDEKTGIIVMTGGHTNPQGELTKAMYDDIVRVIGKDMIKEYPIMKQGTSWILGDRIEIFVKDRNHMRVINSRVSSNKAPATNSSNPGSTR